MRLTSGFVSEGVKYAERRRSEPQGEPDRCSRFLLSERQPRFQKFRNIVFFAGLGFQSSE
jgi:hypothetical protein